MTNPKPTLEELIKTKISINSNGCWIAYPNNKHMSYRQIKYEGKYHLIHRVMWSSKNGPIPPGMLICHECPNEHDPRCCNPDHLVLGTYKSNANYPQRAKRQSEARKGKSSPLKGRKRPEEVKSKISNTLKGHPMSEETKKKISQTKLNKTKPL